MATLTDRQRQTIDEAFRTIFRELGYKDFVSNQVSLGVLLDSNDFPIPQTTKALADNVVTPLFSIDMSQVPDRTFSGKIVYSIESLDATNAQIRSGDLNANVAQTAGGTFATSQNDQATAAITAGSLTVTFSWTTAGNIATFNVNANSSLIPTGLNITYTMIAATHPGIITLL